MQAASMTIRRGGFRIELVRTFIKLVGFSVRGNPLGGVLVHPIHSSDSLLDPLHLVHPQLYIADEIEGFEKLNQVEKLYCGFKFLKYNRSVNDLNPDREAEECLCMSGGFVVRLDGGSDHNWGGAWHHIS